MFTIRVDNIHREDLRAHLADVIDQARDGEPMPPADADHVASALDELARLAGERTEGGPATLRLGGVEGQVLRVELDAGDRTTFATIKAPDTAPEPEPVNAP